MEHREIFGTKLIIPTFAGLLVIVALVWIGGLSWLIIHQSEEFVLADDAYISLRYAQNWVNGVGVVWWPGDRVEGYTNFLQVVLFALGLRLGYSGETVGYTVGMVSALAAVVVAVIIARRLSASEQNGGLAGSIAAVLISANPFFVFWSVSGLETPLFILLCLLSVWAFHEMVNAGLSNRQYARLYAVLTGIALIGGAMTRPDGLILAFAIVAVAGIAIIWYGERRRALLYLFGIVIGVFAIGYGGYFAWRLFYYGQFLPNTFYIKVGSGTEQIRRGIAYVWAMLNITPIHFLLVTGAIVSVISLCRQLVRSRITGSSYHITILTLLLFALFYTLYLIYIGGDFFGIRMAMIVVVVCAILVDHVISYLSSLIGDNFRKFGVQLLFIAPLLFSAPHQSQIVLHKNPTQVNWKKLGVWLRENAHPESVLAVDAAGAIPYYSGLRSIDMYGLNDRYIASVAVPGMGSGVPGHEKYDPAYVYAQHPDWIAIWMNRNGEPDIGLMRWPEIDNYSLYLVVQTVNHSLPMMQIVDDSVDIGTLWDDGYKYGVWKRNDRPVLQYSEVDIQTASKYGSWEWRPRMLLGIDYWFSRTPGDSLTLDVERGTTLAITGVCHDWSGMLEIWNDSSSMLIKVLDFYSPSFSVQCVHRLEVPAEASERVRLRLMVSKDKNGDSVSTEIFINRILILQK